MHHAWKSLSDFIQTCFADCVYSIVLPEGVANNDIYITHAYIAAVEVIFYEFLLIAET